MTASMTRRRLTWAFGLLALVAVALPATAQQQSTPTPPPPAKEEEVPFWAVGKPKSGPRRRDGAGAGVPDRHARPTSCRSRR